MPRACRTSAEGELGWMRAWRGEAVECDGVISRGRRGAKVAEDADKTSKVAVAILVAVVVAVAALWQQVRTLQSQPRTRGRTMTRKGGRVKDESREAKGSLWLSLRGAW